MKFFILLSLLFVSASVGAEDVTAGIVRKFSRPQGPAGAKKTVMALGGRAVPALIQVMKGKEFPWRSRWRATFLLGRVMGRDAGPFLATFLRYPEWFMRLAALKTLLALQDRRFAKEYRKSLRDKSLLVRKQARENLRRLGLALIKIGR